MGMKKKMRTAEFFQQLVDREVSERVAKLIEKGKEKKSKEMEEKDDTVSKGEE